MSRYIVPLSRNELYDRYEASHLRMERDADGKVRKMIFQTPWGTAEYPRVTD